MTDFRLSCQKVAVLGAGTMGTQIAAHFANAGIETLLFDLDKDEGKPTAIVDNAIEMLTKINPAPLAEFQSQSRIKACTYAHDLALIAECDWVIEAVSEKLEIKQSLLTKVAEHMNEHAVLATNTSGLSVTDIADTLPESITPRFCGVHFFNPPRYMPLVELIAHATTDTQVLDELENFLVRFLGKTIVRAKDMPNFIANRIGTFSILMAFHFTEALGLGLEVVDDLTGKRLGRPKSATYRTADLVGLDVLSSVISTMHNRLDNDPWHAWFKVPSWVQVLIDNGALGQKTKGGLYKKEKDGLTVLDLASGQYRASDGKISDAVKAILKTEDLTERFAELRVSDDPQAQFLWHCFRETFIYCAHACADITHNVRDLDAALRCGFGWKQGPFELWQLIGWQQVIQWIEEDLATGKCLTDTPIAQWAKDLGEAGCYREDGAFSPENKAWHRRSELLVYQRQLYPKPFVAEVFDWGHTEFENDGARVWSNDGEVLIITFKSKMNTIGSAVLEALNEAVAIAEDRYRAMVIWQGHSEHFSAGADLMEFAEVLLVHGPEVFNQNLERFQQTVLRMRYSKIPVVGAVRGYVFGGGCELMMHCDQVVAALESYIGLVEVGVGLLPAAGGCKEMALRSMSSQDPEKTFQGYYKHIAMAEVAKSALEAKEFGYLRPGDRVLFNPDEILYVAKKQALLMADANYSAPSHAQLKALGINAAANIKMFLANMHRGGYASDYDREIAYKVANVMTGGDVDSGTVLNESWYMRLEREAFIELVQNDKTQARVQHMLSTGKPLRN